MNISKFIKELTFFVLWVPGILCCSHRDSLYWDEATMSNDQIMFFQQFLQDKGVDYMEYMRPQIRLVGANKKFFMDTSFDKFLNKMNMLEHEACDFRCGHISLDIRMNRLGDMMKIGCRSNVKKGVEELYLCIEVLPSVSEV